MTYLYLKLLYNLCVKDNNCKRLWCTSPGPYGQDNGCKTQHMPWADGTKCGPNMWCVEGRCSQRNSRSPIHGGWSSWQVINIPELSILIILYFNLDDFCVMCIVYLKIIYFTVHGT